MKIIFVLPSLNFSGGVKAVIQIANGLYEKGHEVKIYIPRFPFVNGGKGMLNINRLNEFIEPKVPIIFYLTTKQIPDADVVIATSWETMYTVDDLWQERQDFQPVYFIQHIETWDYYNTGEYSQKDYLALNTYITDYPKIVTSQWLAKKFADPYIVPMGIEPVPDLPEEYWRNPFYHEQPIITGVLRGIPWKGDAILSQLSEEYPIQIYKNVSNQYLDQILWRSDIFLSASVAEGFNLPVLEAMAHGCCCISTNTGAVYDYSAMGSCVMLVDHSVSGFRMALDELKDNPQRIIEYSRRAKRLSKEWTIQKTVNRFEVALNDIFRSNHGSNPHT